MLMYKRLFKSGIAIASAALLAVGCNGNSGSGDIGNAGTPSSQNEKVSYSIGYDIGNNFNKQSIDSLDLSQLMTGIEDGMNGKDAKLEDKERSSVMRQFQQQVMAQQAQRTQEEASKNKKEGEDFLAKNKKKDGVKTTDSGLQYKILKKGTGPSPTADDSVTVNYEGTLVDGTVFDSSYKRGKPVTFPVNGVIKGWTEALQMMHEGGQWKIFIPSDLAYGKRGTRGPIGPNEVLIFKVDLLDVK